MKSRYSLTDDNEPSDLQLAVIFTDANIDAIKKAKIAKKNFYLLQKKYRAMLVKKYAKKIKELAKKT